MSEPTSQEDPKTPESPNWPRVAGMMFGAVTLLYLGVLTALPIFGRAIPPDARFPMLAFLALGVALSTAFLGGDAALKGRLPVPSLNEHPLLVSLTGGIAVFVIVLLVSARVYPVANETFPPERRESLPDGLTVRSAVRYFAESEGFTETFADDCADDVRDAAVRPGPMTARDGVRLIELLPSRLKEPQPGLEIRVTVSPERGVYEIQCTS